MSQRTSSPRGLWNRVLTFALLLVFAPPPIAAAAAISLPATEPQRGILIGQVTDAIDGHPVAGVRIDVRGLVTETDDGGHYRLPNIPLGGLSPVFDADVRRGPMPLTVQFTGDALPSGVGMTATAPGYAPYSSDRVALVANEVALHHFSMTPLPAPGSLRLVLNWGADPADLDAHLGTPPIEDRAYEIYFPASNQGSLVAPPFAALDIDRTAGFGPETITLNRFFPGTYRYFVFNYSAYVNASPVPLTASGATVKLYTEAGEVQSISAPDTGSGLYWHVCDIDGTTQAIRVVNQVTNRNPLAAAFAAPASLPAPRPPPTPARRALLSAGGAGGGGIRYLWDFGDGTTSAEQSPKHTYEFAGTYTVGLTVSAATETNTTIKPGFITVLPTDAPPTLDPLPDLALTQNSGPRVIPLSGISGGLREPTQTVAITASASGPGPELFSALTVDYTPPSSNGLLTLVPIRGRTGTNFVTVTLRDDGDTTLGGTNTFSRTFRVRLLSNRAPAFDFIPVLAVEEQSELRFRLTATDPELPNSRLSFRLANSPPGMELDADGWLTWTPNEGQGPYDAYTVTAEVADDGTPPQRASTRFFVSVREVNRPPTLAVPSPTVIDELAPFRAQLLVADPDVPANSHRFRLLAGPPGLTVSASGFAVWNPREEDGPATNQVVVAITDSGEPPFTVTNAFDLVVREVNAPPLVRLVSPTSGSAFGLGRPVTLEAAASDPDPDGSIRSVAFQAGPRRIGEVSAPPFRFVWTNPPAGPQSLVAIATDDQGSTTTSTPVLIAVEGNCTPRPANLVLWLPGDADADDRLGTNHATWASNPAYAAGLVGPAFDFRAPTAALAVPDHPSLNSTQALTLGLWLFRDEVVGTSDVVAAKPGDGISGAAGFSLEFAWWNANLLRFVVHTPNGPRSSGTLPVPLRKWTHVAAVFDHAQTNGANVQLYVDGSPATATASTAPLLPSNQPLHLGRSPGAPQRSFRGLIDEVMMADRALLPGEIQDIVTARSAGVCPPVPPPPNQPPTLAEIEPVELPEDSPPLDVRLAGISPGPGDDGQKITITALSDNPDLLPDPLVAYVSPGSTALLTLQPTPNRHGIAQVTVTLRDDGGTDRGGVDTFARTLAVTIREVNDPPRLARPADLILGEDTPSTRIPLDAADEETPFANLVFEFAPSNPELLGPGSFVVTGDGPNRRLQVVPAPDQFGSSSIGVIVRDAGGAFARAEFLYSALPVNDPPTLDPLPDLELLEDTRVLSLRLGGISPGPANESGQTLELTATSDNPAILPHPLVEYVSPETEALLTLRPRPDTGGSTLVRVTLRDNGGIAAGGLDTRTRTFRVTVRQTNDPPRITLPATLTLDEDAVGTVVPFEIDDRETPAALLLLSATVGDPTLLDPATITWLGSGPRRSLELGPLPNRFGSTPLTVEVRDAEGAAVHADLLLTVRPINDPPTLDPIDDVHLLEGAPPAIVTLTGLSPGPTNEVGQTITLAVRSDNPDLLPPPTLVHRTPDPTATLELRPAAGRSGEATVTVTVTDTGGTTRGGVDTVSRSFAFRVQEVNDPPRITPLPDLTIDEDAPAFELPLHLEDPESPVADLTITAASSNLVLLPATNLVVRPGSPQPSLTLTPTPNLSGTTRITLTARDPIGDQTQTHFLLTVRPINDPPTFETLPEIELDEDSPPRTLALTAVTPGPPDEAAQPLAWTTDSDTPSLLPAPAISFPAPASEASLILRPEPNQSGTATLRLVLRDDGGTDHGGSNTFARTLAVRVRPINDAPTLDPLPDLVLRENSGPVVVDLAGITAGAPDESQTLTATATSDHPDLVPDPEIDYLSPARVGRLALHPLAGRSGVARITLAVRDDGGTEAGGVDTTRRQFEVLIRSNRPPVVALTQPATLALLEPGTPTPLRAEASDPDGTIARVDFLDGATLLAASTGPVFAALWTNPPAGPHTLLARATDNDGAVTLSAPLEVVVREPSAIDLAGPAPGSIYCPHTPVILAATLHGPVPSGSRVLFAAGTEVLGVADTPPFTLVHRTGLPPGSHDLRATLTTPDGNVLAESTPTRVGVRDECGDVALLHDSSDPAIDVLATLLSGEDMGYTVEILDPRTVTSSQLAGYQLVVWAGLTRPGELLTDDLVRRLAEVHAAGRPLYLVGSRLASDVTLLGPAGRATWESLAGLRVRGGTEPSSTLTLNRGEPGDPIADGPRGLVADQFQALAPIEPAQLVGARHDIKAVAGSSPALLVAPVVCAPDLGQARIAVQNFLVGAEAGADAESRLQRERLFKNTVTWLLRGWYCENVGLELVPLQAPATGRTGEDLAYTFEIRQSGGCGAQGVTLNVDLPAGWDATDVETSSGSWTRAPGRIEVTLGCMDRGALHRITVRLRPSLAGPGTVTAALRADAVGFHEERHLSRVITVVEGSSQAPRLDLRRSGPAPSILATVRLRGDPGVRYRLQRSGNLRDWEDVETLTGAEAEVVVPLESLPGARYYRAVTP